MQQMINNMLVYICVFFNTFVIIKSIFNINSISYKKIKFLIFVLLSSLLIYFSNLYLNNFISTVLELAIIFISSLFLQNENKKIYKTLITIILIALFSFIIDFLLSYIIIFLNLTSYFLTYNYIRTIFSFLNIIILYLFLNNCRINVYIKRIIDFSIEKKLYVTFIFNGLFLIIYVITYYNYFFNDIKSYLIVFFFIFYIILSSIFIVIQFKEQFLLKNEKINLDNMIDEYSNLIDVERKNKHELINNLLYLKSYKNKSSIEYSKTLDDIILKYESKNKSVLYDLSKLPKGIKGLIYYKVKKNNLDSSCLHIFISKNAKYVLNKIENSNYFYLFKIIGILLDNSIEAIKDLNNGTILIDMFTENELFFIRIENNFNKNIDLSKINQKNYSTKGKNRGLGLHIVKEILSNKPQYKLQQSIENDKFISTIIVNL